MIEKAGFDMLERYGMTPGELMDKAVFFRERAYAPYSKFKVGAAVLMDDGSVFGGCNVENGAYGQSICAERVAMTSAVAGGKKNPVAISVTAGGSANCPPCGACRQFLAEFNPRLEVIMWHRGELCRSSLDDLLPLRFEFKEDRS